MNMKDAREVIEAREQIQEDIITYFDDNEEAGAHKDYGH